MPKCVEPWFGYEPEAAGLDEEKPRCCGCFNAKQSTVDAWYNRTEILLLIIGLVMFAMA
jgi:hypothetical protein